jgi:hypothetical protein
MVQIHISDVSPALVEEGVLHPVRHKPWDLPKTRKRVSMVQIHISDVSPALVEEGVLHPVQHKSRDLSKTRKRVRWFRSTSLMSLQHSLRRAYCILFDTNPGISLKQGEGFRWFRSTSLMCLQHSLRRA